MIRVIIIANQTKERNFKRNHLKQEINRLNGFAVEALSSNIEIALYASRNSYIDMLILKPSESERIYKNQIDAIARFRKTNPESGPRSVMIISEIISPYACTALSDANVLYQFVSPRDADGLADKVLDIFEIQIREAKKEKEEIKQRFAEKLKIRLISFGVYPSCAGFKYIVDAVILMKFSPGKLQLTKDLYPYMSKKYGKSEASIERALRIATATVSECQEWKKLFPGHTKKLTNSELIALLAEIDAI